MVHRLLNAVGARHRRAVGLAPLLPWGRGRWAALGRATLLPLAVALVATAAVAAVEGTGSIVALLMSLRPRSRLPPSRANSSSGRGRARRSAATPHRGHSRAPCSGTAVATAVTSCTRVWPCCCSAWLRRPRSTPRARRALKVGERLELSGGREVQYVRSTGRIVLMPASAWSASRSARSCRCGGMASAPR